MDNFIKNINFGELTNIKINNKSNKRSFKSILSNKNVLYLLSGLFILTFFSIWLAVKNSQINSLNNQIKEYEGEYALATVDSNQKQQMLLTEKSLIADHQKSLKQINDDINLIQKTVTSLKSENSELKKKKESVSEKVLTLEDKISKMRFHITDGQKVLSQLEIKYEELIKEYNALTQGYESKDNKVSSSSIITQDQANIIEQWMNMKFKYLCYKGKSPEMDVSMFHRMCDKAGWTLTLIRTDENEILGGFTRKSWSGNIDKEDQEAFIFNMNKEKMYRVKDNTLAISPREVSYPSFGQDLILGQDGIGMSSFPSSYGSKENTLSDFISHKYFFIQEIEVYQTGYVVS